MRECDLRPEVDVDEPVEFVERDLREQSAERYSCTVDEQCGFRMLRRELLAVISA